MSITFSDKSHGIYGIAGHVGCGHCHSLNHQVQDDSSGLSVVLNLFKKATNDSPIIESLEFKDPYTITCHMVNGGHGTGYSRVAITPQEKRLMQYLINKEVINTHTLVLETFGRFYGQGVDEVPVALQAAIANAAVDHYVETNKEHFIKAYEDVGDNIGIIAGTVLNIDGIDTSVMATVNASKGGIGPLEDLEGNSNYGDSKRKIVEALHLDKIPTMIIEAKIYSSFSEGLKENTYFVRADEPFDNVNVALAFADACSSLNVPCIYKKGASQRAKFALKNNTEMVADHIADLANQLHDATTSYDKVTIISKLASMVREDCGGISFMSNDVHEDLGGAGMIRKTSAVINLVSCDEDHQLNPIPFMSDEDTITYTNIVIETLKHLNNI